MEDGRANTHASAIVREVLERVDGAAVSFNDALAATEGVFKERGEMIAQQSGFSPSPPNWHSTEFPMLFRYGVREMRVYPNPHGEGPTATAPAALTGTHKHS